MKKIIKHVKDFWNDEEGLSAVEYVIAGALIVALLVTGLTTLGTGLKAKLNTLLTSLNLTPAA